MRHLWALDDVVMSSTPSATNTRSDSSRINSLLRRFSPNAASLVTQVGAPCSIFFNKRFYDNTVCARKGVTTLAWPKPKLKFNFHKDNVRASGGQLASCMQ